ncbi:MAG: prolipoprotein diacylglyceryl transferase [Candidatus Eisenbacteria bacterium]|nr:prolipoprotein diacylglyceryl transferase [Candidatus Eisenbacteria bacterium]MBU1948196.1 prolipoprotein diacylglyceryl transferase [Candidatus Eisenbacteria bacterium]
MYPILWHIGPLKIHSYGLCLALAFLLGAWIITRRGRRHGLDEADITRWVSLILVSSIAGARIYYVVGHCNDYAGRWGDVIAIWRGGLVLQGGLLAGILASVLYSHRIGWRIGILADVAAPALAFGESLGRLGCYLNGCCFGGPTHCAWGVHFPEGSLSTELFSAQALHPTQLYLVLLQGSLGFFLLAMERWKPARAHRSTGSGLIFGSYLFLSSTIRFFVDSFRYYTEAERPLLGLAHSQLLAIPLVLAGLWIMVKAYRKGA